MTRDDLRMVAINKPVGPTSFGIIRDIKRITGEKRVGHGGTLDPLASGVLVVAIGRAATRTLTEVVGQEKEYRVVVCLGATSTTDDLEGEKTTTTLPDDFVPPTRDDIEKVLPKFVGDISQVPPVFSAVHVAGKRAYVLAREGEKVELAARTVQIKKIEIVEYVWPSLTLVVTTGKGVYIRSLARDIGEELGVGGYVAELARTRVGNFTLAQALTVEEFAAAWRDADISPILPT